MEKRVTLVAPRAYMGEVIEDLARQSGVPLTVGEGAGDIEVTVSLRGIPLASALDALWSLVSYQNTTWEWRRSGAPGHYQYELARPWAARSLGNDLRRKVQQDFVGEAERGIGYLKMSPEELAQAAKSDYEADDVLTDQRIKSGLQIFSEAVPSEMQDSVLSGQQSVQLKTSQLSEAGRDYVHTEWKDAQWKKIHPDGTWEWAPEPQDVAIYSKLGPNDLSPVLFIEFGDMGGLGYVGGTPLENIWLKKTANLWMLPGDATTDPLEARTAHAPLIIKPLAPKPSASKTRLFSSRPLEKAEFAQHLLQLAQGAPLPLIARLPDEQGWGNSAGSVSPYEQTVKAYLGGLHEDAHFQFKWRDGVLLATYPGWFMHDDDDQAAPWAVVKRLRDAEAAAPDGYLPLMQMAWAARQLNPAQLQRLAEFRLPVASDIAQWQELLSDMAASPSLPPFLLSTQGSTRMDALRAAAPSLGLTLEPDDNPLWRVRLRQTDETDDAPYLRLIGLGDMPMTRRSMTVEVMDKSGKIVATSGFSYAPHEYVSGVEGGDH